MNGLLLCTDMDRTVIPNGHHPEHPEARDFFRRFCASPQVRLVYVTGRHKQLVEQAITEYDLPPPDYVVTDVGTRIYQLDNAQWIELIEWDQHISRFWHGKTHADLVELLSPLRGLNLQEASKQSKHKLSYYLELSRESGNIGLIDVVPKHATKLEAIEFLQRKLGHTDADTMFAGDSGNDMEVLISHIPSVLVSNATSEVRQAAQSAVAQNGNAALLYEAVDEPPNMFGNYSAGVLQGVWHFAPGLRPNVGYSFHE